MEQYIDKAALVAEIEKLISKECKDYESYVALAERIATCINVLSILDTLEVKEVDLEEEVTNWWNDRYKKINDDYEFGKYNGHYMENSTIISLAKHFYELGLRTHIPAIYKPTETDVYKLGLKAHKG